MRKALALAAIIGGLAWLERRFPLRARTQPALRRGAINIAMAGVTAVCVPPIQRRLVGAAMSWADRNRIGIVRRLPLPAWSRCALGFVLLDYALWRWHRWNHRVPALWAMHASHHADPDLDLTTAARFHVGEMLASVPTRALQVVVLGVDTATLRAWELAVLMAVAFQHSNLRLPARVDAIMSWLVITPRLHGIHHSARPDRLDTNFGTIFSFWDVLHGTRAVDLDQRDIAVGLPETIGAKAPGLATSIAWPLLRR